jgi:aspartyl-tRNA(Asn)/glutamyl-tRNA(Gln) amidotransferase subunit C
MLKVDENLTKQVANLARLELSDQEAKTFTQQLKQVLEYVDQLQKVNVEGVEMMTHPLKLETPMRKDEVKPSLKNDQGKPKILDSAPDVLYDGYKVPPIM